MAALRRGIAHYQEGTANVVQPPGIGTWADPRTNPPAPGLGAVRAPDGIVYPVAPPGSPGNPQDTIDARRAGYAQKAQQSPDWAAQWGVDPRTGMTPGDVRDAGLVQAGKIPPGPAASARAAPAESQYAQLAGSTMSDAGGGGGGDGGGRGLVQPWSALAGFGAPPPPTEPIVPVAPTGFGQLMARQPAQALSNPNASPLTQWYAQQQMNVQMHDIHRHDQQRALDLAQPPSIFDIAHEFVGGTTNSFNDVLNRYGVARQLGNQLVQQHLVNNPDQLAEAESNPAAYAVKSQTPAFKAEMQRGVQNYADAHAGNVVHTDEQGSLDPKTPENPAAVANTANRTGATLAQSLAAHEPGKFTRDEFIRVVKGMPMQAVQMLFGAQLAHIQSPQEKLTDMYFGQLHKNYADAVATRQALETEDAQRAKAGLPQLNSVGGWFGGKSRIDIAKQFEQEQAAAIMNQAAPVIGTTAKPYPTTPAGGTTP